MKSTSELLTNTGWSIELRPRFEGCNVGTWIGFKHVMYLVEEAVLQFLRDQGLPPGNTLDLHGLGTEIVDSRLRLTSAIRVDDVVRIGIRPATKEGDPELGLAVTLTRRDAEREVKLASGRVHVSFRDTGDDLGGRQPAPPAIARFVVPEIRRRGPAEGAGAPAGALGPIGGDGGDEERAVRERLCPEGSNTFLWTWRIPYFYCHYTERLQHSGYVRIMEEAVDRFLADRGISIGTFLRERRWIPVVTMAHVELLAEARIEDTLYTVYTVEEITKDVTYTARMDCYVVRGGALVQTATGRITHAYIQFDDRAVGTTIAPFDARVIEALSGPKRRSS
jgi:acyl-CoA thioesterase FadM